MLLYKDLYNSKEGQLISHFNVQSYGEYSEEIYDQIISNGYDPKKIVMGSISNQNVNSNINGKQSHNRNQSCNRNETRHRSDKQNKTVN